jgi:hypothetical protein
MPAAPTPPAIPAIPATAVRTIASLGTIRPACGNCLTICVFAIEVWFAFVVGKITAAFKGDGFLAFAAWLRLMTLATFTAARFA